MLVTGLGDMVGRAGPDNHLVLCAMREHERCALGLREGLAGASWAGPAAWPVAAQVSAALLAAPGAAAVCSQRQHRGLGRGLLGSDCASAVGRCPMPTLSKPSRASRALLPAAGW